MRVVIIFAAEKGPRRREAAEINPLGTRNTSSVATTNGPEDETNVAGERCPNNSHQ
jgi:hypothetical protein